MNLGNSIRGRLITASTLLAIVPLLLLGMTLSWQNFIVQREQIEGLQKELTIQAARNVSFYLHEQEQKILSFLRANPLVEMDAAKRRESLNNFIFSSRDELHGHVFNQSIFLDRQGKEKAHLSRIRLITEEELGDRSQAPEFLVPAVENQPYYSPFYFDDFTGEPLLKISIPITDLRTDEFSGVFIAEMTLKAVWEVIAQLKVGKSGTLYIMDHGGRIIAHQNPSVVLRRTVFTVPDELSISKGLLGEKAIVVAEKITLGDTPLFVITELPVSEAFKSINRILLTIMAFILLTLSGSITLGFLIVRRVVKPIETLAATARKISNGDLNQVAPSNSMAELEDLANAFNTMTSRLVRSINDLEHERNFVKDAIESLTHPFYVIDVKDYTIKLANSAANFGKITGKTTCHSLTHNSDTPCSGKDHPCAVQEILKTKKPVVVEHVHHQDDDSPRTYEIHGYPVFDQHGEIIQIIEHNIDITETKVLEEQLRQAQKLEALGSLAGGVAHDFNNILTAIIGYAELVLMRLPEGDPNQEAIKTIRDSGEKAASLTQQLLAFSRKQILEVKVVNINTLVERIAKILNRIIGDDIDLKIAQEDYLWNTKVDPSQVDQILINLAVNARDAMPNGGRLDIETANVFLDEEYACQRENVTPGPHVMLSVTDYGRGMDEKTKDRIFDPFFTTKGHGTGLGLATVYGIVMQHHGHISVYSEKNMGTVFHIYFPATEEASCLVGERQKTSFHGNETIMVVDDEPAVIGLVEATLESLDYQVIKALSGEEALKLFDKNDGRLINLVITDVVMTGMNGRELAQAVKKKSPTTKIIYMSGYTHNVIAKRGIVEDDINFIHKPIRPAELSKKVRETLDREE